METKTYVLSDPAENSNKIWIWEVEGDSLTTRWGRVGDSLQSKTKCPFDRRKDLDTKIREKVKKGYKEAEIVTANVAPTKIEKENVRRAAREQLTDDAEIVGLIDSLVEANRHEIAVSTGGKIDVDLKTGIVSTPIGVVTVDTIDEAQKILGNLNTFIETGCNLDDSVFMSLLGEYLKLVPQTVGRKRGWHREFLPNLAAVSKQNDLLEQLKASAEFAIRRLENAASNESVESIFDAKISRVKDQSEIEKIRIFFESSINNKHASRDMIIGETYRVSHGPMDRAFDAKKALIGNVRTLWHGTRTFNVLSILKHGLIVPKSGGSFQITGRMFGDGIYASDQSTKALNYSRGGVWSDGVDNRCFMFIVEFAMGREHIPKSGWRTSTPPFGYNSTFAKAGESGVLNNEMIVYDTAQARLTHLVEFKRR